MGVRQMGRKSWPLLFVATVAIGVGVAWPGRGERVPAGNTSRGPLVSGPLTGSIYIPASAHASGAAGTNWRTDVEVRNPYGEQATYRIDLLKRGTNNSTPDSKVFTLGPGQFVRYPDLLEEVFHFNGSGALRVTATSGGVQAGSRTYNLMLAGNPLGLPAGSTFGQYVPGIPEADAIVEPEAGRLIMLAQDANYRTNLGLVNLTGQQILQALERSIEQRSPSPELHTPFLQVSGMRFAYDASMPPGERILATEVEGRPLDPQASYTVALDDYLCLG